MQIKAIAVFFAINLLCSLSFGQAAAPLCRVLFGETDARIVLQEELTERDQVRALDSLGADTFMHYTTLERVQSILETRRIIADGKNRVFMTNEAFTAKEAENTLFIGSNKSEGHGDYVIIFKRSQGTQLENSAQNPYEFVHRGSYRIREEDILYVGANPFF